MLNIAAPVSNIESEDFSGVDNEGYNASCDEDGYKERSNWIEARPPIELNQQGRNDDADGTERVLSRVH